MTTLRPQSTKITRRQRANQGLALGLFTTIVITAIVATNLFATVRLSLNDNYFTERQVSDHIVIVALDDASLEAYGRSPLEWSRSVYASLIAVLNTGGARVVSFDLIFAQPTPDDALFAEAITAARSSDNRLRTVVTAAGVGNMRLENNGQIGFSSAVLPVATLGSAADYVGYANTVTDVDGVVRRQPSRVTIEGSTTPTLPSPFATYLAYLRIPAQAAPQLIIPTENEVQVTPERLLAVDANGLWAQHFFGPPGTTFPVYSLRAVVDGEIPAETFADKVVLVGLMQAKGAVDNYPVPSSEAGETMNGVEVQAHAVETLIRNHALRDQPVTGQIFLAALLALAASLLYTQIPVMGKLITPPLGMLLVFAAGSVHFSVSREIVPPLYPALALILPAVINLAQDAANELTRRRSAELLLESVVAAGDPNISLPDVIARLTQDVKRVVQAHTVWIALEPGETLIGYSTGRALLPESPVDDTLRTMRDETRRTRTLVYRDNRIVVPLLSQGRCIGTIAAHCSRAIPASARTLLLDLAQQIAPGLETRILYTLSRQQEDVLRTVLENAPAYMALIETGTPEGSPLSKSRSPLKGKIALASRALQDTLQAAPPADGHAAAPGSLEEFLAQRGVNSERLEWLEQQFQQGEVFQEQLDLGKQTLNLYAAPLAHHNLCVVILSDVTALAELNRVKTQMIRMASHDLKNPLGVISGYLSLLQLDIESFTDEQQRYLQRIEQSTQLMLRLIENILNLEHLRSMEVRTEDIDLSQIALDVIGQYLYEMEQKQQRFVLDFGDQVPLIRGRSVQVTQALANLVSNAVKYTPDGGQITLRLHHRSDETPGGVLRFEVEDTGYGIPDSAQDKLFTEFYRVRSPATAAIPGTGLGLSLVKSVVDAHGGRIWFVSKENVGTTFFVELPVTVTPLHAASEKGSLHAI